MSSLAGKLALVLCLLSSSAFAQNLRVIPVPWVPADPSIPHLAYNGHPTTFKAIARGGNGSYVVEWDFQGDGVFDFATGGVTNRYDLGTTFTYPVQMQRTQFDAVVRVTSNGQTVTAVYPVRVEPDVPADPSFATDRQLQVMRAVAVDDALWYLHKQMVRSGNEDHPLTGAQVSGYVNHPDVVAFYGRAHASSSFLWALGVNGHYVGFPDAYLGQFPEGHAEVNEHRWEQDPYAEDALRLLNEHLSRATVVTVTAADETNNVGTYPESIATPIAGTDDLIGLYFGFVQGQTSTTNTMGYALAALSVGDLTGLVAQVGDANRVLGKSLEHIIQQAVDGLVWSQGDSGCGLGGWYYTPNETACPDAWENLSAVTGLRVADEYMSASGVIVNNHAKLRIATHFMTHANVLSAAEACVPYTFPNPGCDFPATAAAVEYGGWLGFNQYDVSDVRVAFPGYNVFTRGQVRTAHERYLEFIETQWLTWQENTDVGWSGGLWELGVGGFADHERTDRLGNGFTMFQVAKAARAPEPAIVTFGLENWLRNFTIYDIQNQFADGHTQSDWSTNYWENTYGQQWLSTAWTVLTLTGDGLPPFAVGLASTNTAPEGTPITFDASTSVPGQHGATSWIWSFGNGQTDTGAVVVYPYPDNGNFNVTLSDAQGSSVDTIPVTITNVAPSVTILADASAPEGSVVDFVVSVSDPGTSDTHIISWNFDDGGSSSTVFAPSRLFADDGDFTVVATVTDDDGAPGADTFDLAITNVAPAITSSPSAAATEGVAYGYTLTFTDPGVLDTHVCSLPAKPVGMTLTGCTASWTPSYAALAGATSVAVEICVTDDDMGETCQPYEIAVTLADADADGLPDGWEIAFFGSIAAQSGAGDPDGDGRTNAQEYAASQDPTVFGGPSAPVLLTPANGVIASEQSVTLILLDAGDPTGDALTYDYQLATDSTFATVIDSATGVAESPSTTGWTPTIALTENASYCWRARASDGAATSPWSVPACFLRSETNDPPGTPSTLSPAMGGTTSSTRPLLSWLESADPEAGAVFYDVELATASDFASPLASTSGVAGGNVILDVDLVADGTTYYWRVRGVDGSGVEGAWSSSADFVVQSPAAGDDDDDGGGGNGCGCSLDAKAPANAGAAHAFLGLAALALLGVRRRHA